MRSIWNLEPTFFERIIFNGCILVFLGGDLIWNTHGTSMYEGLDGVEWNTIVPQVIIDDVLVFQHIYNKKKTQEKDSVIRFKVMLVFRSMEILTFGMTAFCMRLKYNVKDVFNCGNNSQFTVPVTGIVPQHSHTKSK
jgi:hypothetical protein